MEEGARPLSTIEVAHKGDIDIVTIKERRIFLQIAETFREELVSVIEGGASKLIVDLSQVSVMNSSGLGVLILARDKLKKRNGRIVLCGMQHIMAEIFARMHLDSFFDVAADTEAGLKLFEPLGKEA